jgi:GWxTD domain-containing protein
MITFLQLFEGPEMHALGWSLLHFIWQGALVTLLLGGVLSVVPDRYARFRHAAACIALLLLTLLPIVTFVKLAADQRNVVQISSGFVAVQAFPTIWSAHSDAVAESWIEQVLSRFNRALPAVICIWFAGVILLLARLHAGILTTRKMKRLTSEVMAEGVAVSFRDLKRRLGITRAVGLVQSALVETPIVIGWLRPVVLLPIGCLTGLSTIQLEALLSHELAHIRRHDYLISVLQAAAEALLFYHPAVWWTSRQIRIEREHCCDDIAVAVCGSRLAYAQTLSLLEIRRSAEPILGLGAHGGSLMKRIKRLLDGDHASHVLHTRAIHFAAAVLAVGVLLLAAGAKTHASLATKLIILTPTNAAHDGAVRTIASSVVRQNAHPEAVVREDAMESSQSAEGKAPADSADPFRLWIEEDVRWIILPEERSAYLALANNEERTHFIEQFWERRNPHPGSPDNLFREEHYRRIAYANTRFAGGGPGWASDRGRVYIQDGPPDSIDSHPSGMNGSTKPFEVWHYRTIPYKSLMHGANGEGAESKPETNVDFRFVDSCSCGDFKLQPSS